MSKAEDRALKAYPKDIEKYVDVNGVKSVVDNNGWQRAIFLKGYNQAEKDLELTWKDIKIIHNITYEESRNVALNKGGEISEKEFYQEVLKRFKERKK